MSKGSTDKRGWSFRKRSARHRVLINTVISETPSTGNKESPETTAVDFHPSTNPMVPEKISASQGADETTQLLITENPKILDPLVAADDVSKADYNLQESDAIVIQAAIRGFLARITLLKLKNVIKLQAAMRGHLVRRQAVGSLRCVQAIVKMQALVRARRAHTLAEGLVSEEKLNGKHEKNNQTMGNDGFGTKANQISSSTEKLLSNGFARQLLQSTPKTKPIQIKCDPLRHDSAWKWLERWMAVSSSSEFAQSQRLDRLENQEQGEKAGTIFSEVGTEITAEVVSETADLKSNIRETETSLESEENLITYDANNYDFQACCPTSSSARDDHEQAQLKDVGFDKAQETLSKIDLPPNQTESQPGASSSMLASSVSEKPEMDNEQPKLTVKWAASEQLETEGKKFGLGSRKACNPAFIAAQSKFEELSSTATSGRLIASTCPNVGVESKRQTISSPANSITRAKDTSPTENSTSHDSRFQIGGSDCGIELSVSSTLDSPDRSEVGGEFDSEAKVAERGTTDPSDFTDHSSTIGDPAVEDNTLPSTSLSIPSHFVSNQLEKNEDVNGESVDSIVAAGSLVVEQQTERSASDVQIQLDQVINQRAYRSSPEGSPRSHVTVTESHGTPSSQVSVKAKRNQSDKSRATQARTSESAGKRSPANHSPDSSVRSSTEQLPKDLKNGKRRNSFGSTRPDHIDQERRDSGSSNSLPGYMQATESARAKAHAHNSPRSSPDVQDKDIYMKKRHSLPGANGKEGSPRMQRSMSQAQKGVKGNGAHSLHERKWQR
ncbi:PREDICTED: protein IQ-DOMAIN 32-like isoform X2 [Nelumbo nucifera]|uniref:Protein IQ-DOMAIN 32-like isoform X2 n=1 Tax=Nelumbo nucifera TaxID=4432 RepID=A0A1U8ATP7_NELNU|nr:PREDICTED: protein IQ-DOMAIN 32-like isoform X2 [Nelumbo nucifera]